MIWVEAYIQGADNKGMNLTEGRPFVNWCIEDRWSDLVVESTGALDFALKLWSRSYNTSRTASPAYE